MTEHMNPTEPTPKPGAAHDAAGDGNTPDETFTWTGETEAPKADGGPAEPAAGAGASVMSTATAILESLRGAVDDLAERAAPTMREFSARAAELAAVAADRAVPLAKRAGEVTADVSGKLASKSRDWASDLRSSPGSADDAATPTPAAGDAATPTPAAGDVAPKPAAGNEPPGPA